MPPERAPGHPDARDVLFRQPDCESGGVVLRATTVTRIANATKQIKLLGTAL